MKRLLLLFVTLFSIASLKAEGVYVSVTAPTTVLPNQSFQIVFTIHNASPDSFRLNRIDHLKLTLGARSRNSITPQIVGGRIHYSREYSLIYKGVIDKEGVYKLPEAKIWSKGKVFKSHPVKIKCISEKKYDDQKSNLPIIEEAGINELSSTDVFIKTEWENKDIYAKTENHLLVKLYYKVNVLGWQNFDYLKDMNAEVVDAGIDNSKKYGKAEVNGVTYNTVVLSRKVVLPHEKGELMAGSGSVEIIGNIPRIDYWGGYRKVKRKLIIPGFVKSVLPQKTVEQSMDDEPSWNL